MFDYSCPTPTDPKSKASLVPQTFLAGKMFLAPQTFLAQTALLIPQTFLAPKAFLAPQMFLAPKAFLVLQTFLVHSNYHLHSNYHQQEQHNPDNSKRTHILIATNKSTKRTEANVPTFQRPPTKSQNGQQETYQPFNYHRQRPHKMDNRKRTHISAKAQNRQQQWGGP